LVNQFLVQAAAEKVASLKARGYLAERAARAKPGTFGRILANAGSAVAIPGHAAGGLARGAWMMMRRRWSGEYGRERHERWPDG
jgi:hypothetical protein